MITKQDIHNQIKSHTDTVSDEFRELFENSSVSEICSRENFIGHITASGTIVHFPSREVLLLHHKTLDKWHVPGGHIEPEDESTISAAMREVEEETGITPAQLKPLYTIGGKVNCLEINSHPIPRNDNKKEEAHFHHDFRYIFRYDGDKKIAIDDNESLDYKWVSVNDPYLRQILNQPELEAIIYSEMLNDLETSPKNNSSFNERRKMMALAKIAEIYKEIGRYDLSRHAYRQLLKVTEQLIEDEGEKLLSNLGRYQYEYAGVVNDTRIAEQMYLKAIETYQTVSESRTIDENLTKTLEICSSLASLYVKCDRVEMIECLCDNIISYYQNSVADTRKFLNINVRILIKFLSIHESLGNTEKTLHKIVDTYEMLKQNGESQCYSSPAKYMVELGEKTEDKQTKEDLYIKAAEKYKELYLKYGQDYLSEIISVNEILSDIYIESGRVDLAETLITENLKFYEQITKNCQRDYLCTVAQCYETHGAKYYEKGDIEKAEQMYLKAVDKLEITGDDNILIHVLSALTEIYKENYLFSQEDDIMSKMTDVYHRLIESAPDYYISDFANHQYNIWQRYFKRGRLEQSKQAYFDIIKASREYGEIYDNASSLFDIDEKLAEVYNKNEDRNLEDYTNPSLMDAYEYISSQFPVYYRETIAEYQFKLGNIYFRNGETESAENMYLAAKSKFEETYDDEYETPPSILSVMWNLALIYKITDRHNMEISILNQGVEMSEYFASVDDNFASESSKFQNALKDAKSRA